MAYLNDQCLVAITTNFDATGLEPVSSLNFTTYPLQVVETNESSRIRLCLNATGGVFLTTAAPAEYDASNWVRTVYGNPGPWLSAACAASRSSSAVCQSSVLWKMSQRMISSINTASSAWHPVALMISARYALMVLFSLMTGGGTLE